MERKKNSLVRLSLSCSLTHCQHQHSYSPPRPLPLSFAPSRRRFRQILSKLSLALIFSNPVDLLSERPHSLVTSSGCALPAKFELVPAPISSISSRNSVLLSRNPSLYSQRRSQSPSPLPRICFLRLARVMDHLTCSLWLIYYYQGCFRRLRTEELLCNIYTTSNTRRMM